LLKYHSNEHSLLQYLCKAVLGCYWRFEENTGDFFISAAANGNEKYIDVQLFIDYYIINEFA